VSLWSRREIPSYWLGSLGPWVADTRIYLDYTAREGAENPVPKRSRLSESN
jgi:hypothetical protein